MAEIFEVSERRCLSEVWCPDSITVISIVKTGSNTTTSKCKVFIKYITVISNACKDTLNRNFAVVVLYIIRIEADSSPVLGTGTARIQVALEPNANVSSLLERSNIF